MEALGFRNSRNTKLTAPRTSSSGSKDNTAFRVVAKAHRQGNHYCAFLGFVELAALEAK